MRKKSSSTLRLTFSVFIISKLRVFIRGQKAQEWGQTNVRRRTERVSGLEETGSEILWYTAEGSLFFCFFHQLQQLKLNFSLLSLGRPCVPLNLMHSGSKKKKKKDRVGKRFCSSIYGSSFHSKLNRKLLQAKSIASNSTFLMRRGIYWITKRQKLVTWEMR